MMVIAWVGVGLPGQREQPGLEWWGLRLVLRLQKPEQLTVLLRGQTRRAGRA